MVGHSFPAAQSPSLATVDGGESVIWEALATVDGVEGGVENGGTNSETERGACNVGKEGDGGLAVRHCCDLS